MKTNPALKLLKTSTLVPFVIAIAAALLPRPVSAQAANNQLVITEDSSTSLSATYNGSAVSVTFSPITPAFPERWIVTLPVNVSYQSPGEFAWTEPENSSNSNVLAPSPTFGNQFFVTSDGIPPGPPVTPVGDETGVFIGTPVGSTVPIIATFDDDGDVATVPDTGSTLGLLVLALAGLFGARRIRSFRAA